MPGSHGRRLWNVGVRQTADCFRKTGFPENPPSVQTDGTGTPNWLTPVSVAAASQLNVRRVELVSTDLVLNEARDSSPAVTGAPGDAGESGGAFSETRFLQENGFLASHARPNQKRRCDARAPQVPATRFELVSLVFPPPFCMELPQTFLTPKASSLRVVEPDLRCKDRLRLVGYWGLRLATRTRQPALCQRGSSS